MKPKTTQKLVFCIKYFNNFMYRLAPTLIFLLMLIRIIKMSCISWDAKVFPIVLGLCFSIWMINKYADELLK